MEKILGSQSSNNSDGSIQKTYDAIDIAKLIASVLIFSMHCNLLADYGNAAFLLEISARWGVPFFFICSSYFLFRKNKDGIIEQKIIRKYIKRIALLYISWFIINIPSVIIIRLKGKDLSDVGTWLTFFRESLLSSTFTGSWYLVSCIFSAFLVYELSRIFRNKTILIITAVFYILCVFTSAYNIIPASGFSDLLDFLCFPLNIFNGCFYFAVGKCVAENQGSITGIFNKKVSLLCFVISFLLFGSEMYLTKHLMIYKCSDVAFSTIMMGLFMFLFCLQAEIRVKNSIVLRKLSTVIYCGQGNALILYPLYKRIAAMAIICIAVCGIRKADRRKWTKYLT